MTSWNNVGYSSRAMGCQAVLLGLEGDLLEVRRMIGYGVVVGCVLVVVVDVVMCILDAKGELGCDKGW